MGKCIYCHWISGEHNVGCPVAGKLSSYCDGCHLWGAKHNPSCSNNSDLGLYPTATDKCRYCFRRGGHSLQCPNYGIGLTALANTIKDNEAKESTMGAHQVIEAVVLKRATDDEDAKILFGPKAYVATDTANALVQATADAIAAGVEVDATTEVRTRFFS